MFYYLNGILAAHEAGLCVIDCGGVGYQLTVSLLTSEKLSGKEGKTVKLYTYLAVREDGVELFGFGSSEERTAFNRLITVSGVGPKAAMAVLSAMTPEALAVAICTEDVKSISKANGVGSKTAARIVLELKDKIAKEIGSSPLPKSADVKTTAAASPIGGNLSEAMEALLVLGYDRATVTNALRGLDPKEDVGTLIRQVLKKFASH